MKAQPLEISRLTNHAEAPHWLEIVRQQVASLNYGVVQITIHNAQVVQVEKTEKIRFPHQPQAD